MQVVIDANIVISLLIKPGKSIDLFFREELEVFAPELLFIELENNKEELAEKSRLEIQEINELLARLRRKIKVISEGEFIKFKALAEKICPHSKDVTYFALALYLHCPIWTNEKKLRDQSHVEIYSTYELLSFFGMLQTH